MADATNTHTPAAPVQVCDGEELQRHKVGGCGGSAGLRAAQLQLTHQLTCSAAVQRRQTQTQKWKRQDRAAGNVTRKKCGLSPSASPSPFPRETVQCVLRTLTLARARHLTIGPGSGATTGTDVIHVHDKVLGRGNRTATTRASGPLLEIDHRALLRCASISSPDCQQWLVLGLGVPDVQRVGCVVIFLDKVQGNYVWGLGLRGSAFCLGSEGLRVLRLQGVTVTGFRFVWVRRVCVRSAKASQ